MQSSFGVVWRTESDVTLSGKPTAMSFSHAVKTLRIMRSADEQKGGARGIPLSMQACPVAADYSLTGAVPVRGDGSKRRRRRFTRTAVAATKSPWR